MPLLPQTGLFSRRFDFSSIFTPDFLTAGISYQVINRSQNSERIETLDEKGRTSRFYGDSKDEIEISVIGKLTKEQKWALIPDNETEHEDHCCACDEEDHDCEEISETEEVVEDNLLEDYNQFGN